MRIPHTAQVVAYLDREYLYMSPLFGEEVLLFSPVS
jgi:hypothetical protein